MPWQAVGSLAEALAAKAKAQRDAKEQSNDDGK